MVKEDTQVLLDKRETRGNHKNYLDYRGSKDSLGRLVDLVQMEYLGLQGDQVTKAVEGHQVIW